MNDIAKLADNPALLERQLSKMVETAMAVATTYGLAVVGAVIILIAGWTAAGFVHRAIMRAGRRAKNLDVTLFSFAASLARYAVLVFTVLAVLSSFGVQTTSFIAVLGAASLAIGLALQGALSHVAAGLMIIVFRPFRIGDSIELGSLAGTVDDISLFTTEIRSADNVKIIVPNSVVWRDSIKNLSAHRDRRVVIEAAISPAVDSERIIKELEAAIAAEADILKDPAPKVGIAKLTEAAVTLQLEVWVPRAAQASARARLHRFVKRAADQQRAGIAS